VTLGTATLTGLPAKVNVSHSEDALDTLAIDTGAGDGTVDLPGSRRTRSRSRWI
jgi:hypothetical protein